MRLSLGVLLIILRCIEANTNYAAERVRSAWKYAFSAYKEFAHGRDELRPLSQDGKDTIGVGLTLIESLDALWLLEMHDDLETALAFDRTSNGGGAISLEFGCPRLLGALLSVHALTGDIRVKRRALALGERLSAAFLASNNSIPFAGLASLADGVVINEERRPTNGLCILEFRQLAAISGRQDFFDVGATATIQSWMPYYENVLLKPRLQLGQHLPDTFFDQVNKIHTTLYRDGHLLHNQSQDLRHHMPHSACAWPGLLALAAANTKNMKYKRRRIASERLLDTCLKAHTMNGKDFRLPPEALNFKANNEMSPAPTARHSSLRPETAESLFYFYRHSHNPKYVHYGWLLFEAIEKEARLPRGGYAELNDFERKHSFVDSMPSHLLARTFKFLYLLFTENATQSLLPESQWIFNAAGHPLPIITSTIIQSITPKKHVIIPGVGRLARKPGESALVAALRFASACYRAGHPAQNVTHLCLHFETNATACQAGTVSVPTRIGNLTCEPWRDPTRVSISFIRNAISRGIRISREHLQAVYTTLCEARPCFEDLPPPLSLAVGDGYLLTVEPWEEPVEVVEKFARTVLVDGVASIETYRTRAEDLVRWFCDRRRCTRTTLLPSIRYVKASVVVECDFWEPPEFAVLKASPVLTHKAIEEAIDWLCTKRECGQRLHTTLRLRVWEAANESVGELVCAPLRDPADCVEDFVRKSLNVFDFDLPIPDLAAAVDSMMSWLCARRLCSRSIAPDLTLRLAQDRELLAVHGWEEPAKAVASYAKKTGLLQESVLKLAHDQLCRRRWLCAPLPSRVGLEFTGVGSLSCREFEEPADCVESFAHKAVSAGYILHARDLQRMLNLMCTQRKCNRNKLSVVARALVMHPGKTAGRALATALATTANVFVLGHDRRCGRSVNTAENTTAQACFLVLRHPADRFISALAFKKQGGEHGGEKLLGNLCHRWLADRHLADVISDPEGLNTYCQFANASVHVSTHCVFRPLLWWLLGGSSSVDDKKQSLNLSSFIDFQKNPDGDSLLRLAERRGVTFMCYDTIATDFNRLLRPYCDPANSCNLKRQNPSNHSLVLGPNDAPNEKLKRAAEVALVAFVNRFYAADLALYNRYCGSNKFSIG